MATSVSVLSYSLWRRREFVYQWSAVWSPPWSTDPLQQPGPQWQDQGGPRQRRGDQWMPGLESHWSRYANIMWMMWVNLNAKKQCFLDSSSPLPQPYPLGAKNTYFPMLFDILIIMTCITSLALCTRSVRNGVQLQFVSWIILSHPLRSSTLIPCPKIFCRWLVFLNSQKWRYSTCNSVLVLNRSTPSSARPAVV